MEHAGCDSFSEQVARELARRSRQVLTIDEKYMVRLPPDILARYDLEAGVEYMWSNEDESSILVLFLTLKADDRGEQLARAPRVRGIRADCEQHLGRSILPAQFGFAISSPEAVGGYSGTGVELIITTLQWRQSNTLVR
jgi:hypothetical protein